MDPDDKHYYCCGDCKALFPTLSSLGRHKAKCNGSKVIGDESVLYAYNGAHLQNILECTLNCTHRDTCPMITKPAPVKGRGKRTYRTNINLQKKVRKTMPQDVITSEQRKDPTSKPETEISTETSFTQKENLHLKKSEAPKPDLAGHDVTNENLQIKEVKPLPDFEAQFDPNVNINTLAAVSDILTYQEPVSLIEHTGDSTQLCEVDNEIKVEQIVEEETNLHKEAVQIADHDIKSAEALLEYAGTNPIDTDIALEAQSESCAISHKVSYRKTDALCEEWKPYVKPIDDGSGGAPVYECTVCKWITPHIGFFVRHVKRHEENDCTLKCSQCEFTCQGARKMKLHLDKHVKPFMCECCSLRFARKTDLERHLYTHSAEYPYKCDHCEYRCRQTKSLTEHKRKHTGQLMECPVEWCQFKTAYSWALKTHQLGKHTATKRLQCPQCTYKTNDPTSMLRHQRLHAGQKNYKCSVCSFRAVAKHDIVKHMRSHTKEKIFFCDRCEFSTSHSSALRIHMMNHLGIKPWQCVLCGFNSLTRSKVIRHVKHTHRGQGPEDPGDAVANLGLKLDMDVTEYKTPHAGSNLPPKVVYEVHHQVEEEEVGAEGQDGDGEKGAGQEPERASTVAVVLHEVPAEEAQGYIQVVTSGDPDSLDLSSLEGAHFQQLTDAITLQHKEDQQQAQQDAVRYKSTESAVHILQAAAEKSQLQTHIQAELDPETQTWRVIGINTSTQDAGASDDLDTDVNISEVVQPQAGETTVGEAYQMIGAGGDGDAVAMDTAQVEWVATSTGGEGETIIMEDEQQVQCLEVIAESTVEEIVNS